MTTTWHGWFGLGGQIKGAPTVIFPTADTIDVYVRGMDDRLWQKWWDGKKWNPSDLDWLPHDDGAFRLGSSPTVIGSANFRDIYVRGADGKIYHKFWNGKWSGWFGLGGECKGAVAAVNPTPSTIDVYIRGLDDRLWQKWWDGTKWNPSDTGWVKHDDGAFRLGDAPVVVSGDANFRDVYVRGADGSVYHKIWNGSKWSGWFGLGGLVVDSPSVVRVNPTFQDIYVRGLNNRLWQKWWDGTKWNPSDAGWVMHHDGNVRIGSAPAVASAGNSSRDVYVRGENGAVLHKFWNNQRHSNATTIRADAAKSAQIDAAVNTQTGPGKPGMAVAVVKNGRIVHLAGYGHANPAKGIPATSETMFHIASCSKQFTALGIMMLQESTPLEYDDHIGKHIPELKGYPAGVTLRTLLHHTSDILELYGVPQLFDTNPIPTNADLIKAAVKAGFPMNPDAGGPGTKFVYVNSEYDLLGSVIERVSGLSYAEFFRKRIFEPLGMTDSFSLPNDARLGEAHRAIGHDFVGGKFVPQGSFSLDSIVGAGSIYTSAYDLCAYEEALTGNFLSRRPPSKRRTSPARTPRATGSAGMSAPPGTSSSLRTEDSGRLPLEPPPLPRPPTEHLRAGSLWLLPGRHDYGRGPGRLQRLSVRSEVARAASLRYSGRCISRLVARPRSDRLAPADATYTDTNRSERQRRFRRKG